MVRDAAYQQGVLLLAFLMALMAVSWNIISGFAGYVSLGHSVFLGLGAYTGGLLAEKFRSTRCGSCRSAGLVAFVAALLVGMVVLRARGHAFVIITSPAAAMEALVNNCVDHPRLQRRERAAAALGFEIQNIPFYFMFLALLALTVGFAAWIRRTKFGTGLLAIREDEDKAAAIGVNTTRYKVLGVRGERGADRRRRRRLRLLPDLPQPDRRVQPAHRVTIVLSALVGGRGTLWGPVLGAFVVTISARWPTSTAAVRRPAARASV